MMPSSLNDTMYWSPRWRRFAVIGDSALILFDLHTEFPGSKCPQCGIKAQQLPDYSQLRFILVEYGAMTRCSACGGPIDLGGSDITLYVTNDEVEADSHWADAERQLLEEWYDN